MWREWIRKRGIKKTADELGRHYETVRAWVNKGLKPNDDAREKLVKLAEGEFGYADFHKD